MALHVERSAEGWRAFDADNPEIGATRPDRAEAIHAAEAQLSEWNAAQKREAQAQARATAHVPMATRYAPLNPFGAGDYVAELAYPGKPTERTKVRAAVEAWVRDVARKQAGWSLATAKAQGVAYMRRRDCEAILLKAFHTVHRRLAIETELYWHGLRTATEATEPRRRMFEGMVKRGFGSNIDNAARTWAETKPVMHLAIAFHEKAVPLFTSQTPSVEAVLNAWYRWLEPSLLRAEELRQRWTADSVIRQAAHLPIPASPTNATMADLEPMWDFTEADMVRLLPVSGFR